MEITDYRARTFDAIRQSLEGMGPIGQALDFGSGDGYFCDRMRAAGLVEHVTPLDVVERKNSKVRPVLYAGGRLPFADASFDLVYAVDVLHHCPDPGFALAEMLRCSRRLVLLKDHNCNGWAGHWTLALLDELGNRRFGIPSPGRYQRNWAWVDQIKAQGFLQKHWGHPLRCHVGALGALTNSLQFVGLWQRP